MTDPITQNPGQVLAAKRWMDDEAGMERASLSPAEYVAYREQPVVSKESVRSRKRLRTDDEFLDAVFIRADHADRGSRADLPAPRTGRTGLNSCCQRARVASTSEAPTTTSRIDSTPSGPPPLATNSLPIRARRPATST